MAGEIISERRATSNRNGGRHHPVIPGDFRRNQQSVPAKLTMGQILYGNIENIVIYFMARSEEKRR
jgi:hypothetical protein